MQYAAVATQEALEDAKWYPDKLGEREMTVSLELSFAFDREQIIIASRVSVLAPALAASRTSTILAFPSMNLYASRISSRCSVAEFDQDKGTEESLSILHTAPTYKPCRWTYINQVRLQSQHLLA